MDKQTFTLKLYEACSDDELRPVMMCVHFRNGYAYASDSKIVVKQSLEYHTIINPEVLEGKCIHRDNFRDIMKFEIAEATENGVMCKDSDGRTAVFDYFNMGSDSMPNFESVLVKQDETPVSFIGFTPELFTRLMKAIHAPVGIIRVRFHGIDKPMFVDVPDIPNQCAIVMPALLNDTLF